MTREEAIELIHDIQTDDVYLILPEEKEALDMAISALSEEENTMEWKEIYDTTEVGGNIIARFCGVECSKCNKQTEHMYNFCPHCGRMRGE